MKMYTTRLHAFLKHTLRRLCTVNAHLILKVQGVTRKGFNYFQATATNSNILTSAFFSIFRASRTSTSRPPNSNFQSCASFYIFYAVLGVWDLAKIRRNHVQLDGKRAATTRLQRPIFTENGSMNNLFPKQFSAVSLAHLEIFTENSGISPHPLRSETPSDHHPPAPR